MSQPLSDLLTRVRACTHCAPQLSHRPRPIVQLGAGARVVIIGQAPGAKVHRSGVPWDDPSGDRLRGWLGVDAVTFYDPGRIALIPMGLCYPGKGASGDLPPRPECAPLWHEELLGHVPEDSLRVIIGAYAQARYVPDRARTLTETVRRWRSYLPGQVVLPHPSPRNQRWLSSNLWFGQEVLPAVRQRVAEVLG